MDSRLHWQRCMLTPKMKLRRPPASGRREWASCAWHSGKTRLRSSHSPSHGLACMASRSAFGRIAISDFFRQPQFIRRKIRGSGTLTVHREPSYRLSTTSAALSRAHRGPSARSGVETGRLCPIHGRLCVGERPQEPPRSRFVISLNVLSSLRRVAFADVVSIRRASPSSGLTSW